MLDVRSQCLLTILRQFTVSTLDERSYKVRIWNIRKHMYIKVYFLRCHVKRLWPHSLLQGWTRTSTAEFRCIREPKLFNWKFIYSLCLSFSCSKAMIPFSTRSSIAIFRVISFSIPLIFFAATASNISGCIPLYAAVPIFAKLSHNKMCLWLGRKRTYQRESVLASLPSSY